MYVLDKALPDKRIRKIPPKNCFLETHLYASADRTDWVVEEMLSFVEGLVKPIIDKISHAIKDGSNPDVSEEDRRALCAFVHIQSHRVPSFRQELLGNLDELLREYGEEHPDSEFANEEAMAAAIHNVWAWNVPRLLPNSLPVTSEGIALAVVRGAKPAFIIGDNPVIRTHTSEVWLPLASNIAIGILQPPKREILLLEGSEIRALNQAIYEQSDMLAGSSYELVASLSSRLYIPGYTFEIDPETRFSL